jgi:uncharacterized protein YqeY
MALYDRLQTELVDARKRRDELAMNTLSLLKSEVVRATKDAGAGGAIDDDLVERVARKEVRRRQDAIEAYRKGGRQEAAQREEAEMGLLRSYLPAAMSAEQVEAEVRDVIAELKPDGPNAFGAVMKAATARLAGRAEGGQIAAAARKLLASEEEESSAFAPPAPRGASTGPPHGRASPGGIPGGNRAGARGSVSAGDRDDPVRPDD